MVTQVMDLFGLEADQDLNLMAPRQTLTHVTLRCIAGLAG
jgi:UDP-N-acetylglucosamine 2-epimerase (non-hydrolysing)